MDLNSQIENHVMNLLDMQHSWRADTENTVILPWIVQSMILYIVHIESNVWRYFNSSAET